MNFEQKMFRGTEKKYIVYLWLPISFLKLSAAFSAFYIRLSHMLTAVVPVCKTYNIALKEKISFKNQNFGVRPKDWPLLRILRIFGTYRHRILQKGHKFSSKSVDLNH